jgi:hypothetical protein
MYHLKVASLSEDNKATHCPHADEDGSGQCVDPPDDAESAGTGTAGADKGGIGASAERVTSGSCTSKVLVTVCCRLFFDAHIPNICTHCTNNLYLRSFLNPIHQFSGLTLTQTVNLVDESILMTLTADKEAWLAYGLSPAGKMPGSSVVIGKPEEGTVKQ